MKMVPDAIIQFYEYGKILETYYDMNEFPADFDLSRNLYKLNSNTNNMTPCTVLYHPSILHNNRETIR